MLRCTKVLITGGSSGIGLAIAKRLSREGALVTLAGRSAEKLAKARDAIGANCAGYLLWDVSNPSENAERLAAAEKMMGGLDGLVNSAGISSESFGRGYEPWDITPEEWDTVMDTNLKGAFFLLRDFIDVMRARGRKANVLNIASNAACMDITGPYGASKLALIRMTRALAKRCGRDGVIMNGIAPGCTYTPMLNWASGPDDELPRSVLNRFARPEEIADLAAYLMSEESVIICGHTVVADGADSGAVL